MSNHRPARSVPRVSGMPCSVPAIPPNWHNPRQPAFAGIHSRHARGENVRWKGRNAATRLHVQPGEYGAAKGSGHGPVKPSIDVTVYRLDDKIILFSAAHSRINVFYKVPMPNLPSKGTVLQSLPAVSAGQLDRLPPESVGHRSPDLQCRP